MVVDIFKAELKTFGDKVYTNFSGLNVSEDGIKCQSFTTISINCLLVYENKYYLWVYLDNCTYTIVNMQIINYLLKMIKN